MNYSKHSKPVRRRKRDPKGKRDAMAMNHEQTRTYYKAREVEQDKPDGREVAKENYKVLAKEHKTYKKPTNGVVTPYGKA